MGRAWSAEETTFVTGDKKTSIKLRYFILSFYVVAHKLCFNLHFSNEQIVL